ncbi:Putative F-box/LRR-repeat protein At3g18150 [Linum grandiflorum]
MATSGDRGSKKKASNDPPEEDRISALTQELLVDILSLLTYKEAARTSVLSKRWVDMWKYVPNLELDYGSMVNKSLGERKTYIQLVSKVLAQHKGPKVNSLRVCLQLASTSNSNGDIERWVEFAISKGVERLELDFNSESAELEFDRMYEEFRGYPVHSRLKFFHQSRVLLGLFNVQCFRVLRLRYVHLSDMILHHLVSRCHLLEKLVLERCDGLVKVNATPLDSSSVLPLKHLEIVRCPYVKEIEIDAPNLVTFRYDGCKVDLRMENVSKLKEIYLRVQDFSNYREVGIKYISPYDLLLQHQSKFVQLETLTFEKDFSKHWYNGSVDEFPFLKQLTVYVDSRDGLSDDYDHLVPLINACPSLHQLSLQSMIDEDEDPMYDYPIMVSDSGPWEELRPSIKVLEITGFDTYSTDSFLDYVLHHFVMLEKLILNHRKRHRRAPALYYDSDSDEDRPEATIAKCISHWKSLFPSTVEFVVL